MTRDAREAVRQEAIDRLREWLKPGDTVYTQLKHVSRSGMSRVIQIVKISCRPETDIDGNAGAQPEILYLGYNVAEALGWKYDRDREGVKVGGCGMDMGFHVVHSLGYALYGKEASEGEGDEANALREALFNADPFYYQQGGAKKPDTTKPGGVWFGGAGYAFKQRWL